MSDARNGRRVVRRGGAAFLPYDLEGPVQPEMSWLPVSFDRRSGNGCYLMRMEPGAVTIPHRHDGVEDFIILEGELIDDDGAVFGPGDFVSYAAGTHHNSRTETGCLIAVFEWDKPEPAG
jgi:anti-sigma factor ChrR (cupin superfamily)